MAQIAVTICDAGNHPINGRYYYHHRLDAQICEDCCNKGRKVQGEDISFHAMEFRGTNDDMVVSRREIERLRAGLAQSIINGRKNV